MRYIIYRRVNFQDFEVIKKFDDIVKAGQSFNSLVLKLRRKLTKDNGVVLYDSQGRFIAQAFGTERIKEQFICCIIGENRYDYAKRVESVKRKLFLQEIANLKNSYAR